MLTEQNKEGQEEEYYIFELSENVERTAVTFHNHYGIELSGDLYIAQDLDDSISHPALVIGPIGICGSGGFALAAAQVDIRIKAVATASLFDVSASSNGLDAEAWFTAVDSAAQQRWDDVDNETPEYIPTYPETPTEEIPEGLEGIWAEFYSFYGLERGHHPRTLGGFTTTSNLAFYNFQLLDHLDMLTQPVLFMAGENAETRPISEAAYGVVSGTKELCIVPEANHVDLYDDTDRIPFDTLVEFFNENM